MVAERERSVARYAAMTATAPPPTLPIVAGAIPPVLIERPQWVGWDWERRDGKWTKPLRAPRTGRHASATDPATWAPFPDALAAVEAHGWAGIGYVFSADDPFAGVDLDGCRDPDTGALAPWAAEIVAELGSYAEASPSGRGVHILVRAALPTGDGKRRRSGPIEMYDAGRYFTMTGHSLSGATLDIARRQSELDAVYARTFPPVGPPPAPPSSNGHGPHLLDDDALIARAQDAANGAAFDRLFLAGDTSGHGDDDSAADLALCSHLTFWTRDADQVDRLFRRSGLYREKWERADYRERTIAKAMDRAEVYVHSSGWATIAENRGAADLAPSGAHASTQRLEPAWPTLAPTALHGLAGEVVRALDPHTEGDPAAVLVNFLVMFGSAVGGAPFCAVGEARHGANQFAVHVGATAKARKGTAHTDTLGIVRRADPSWAGERVTGGLSSGEGLVWPIRDPIEGTTKKGETVLTDPGVTDKRLLVVEEEFSAVAKVAGREGNTLSEQIRKAWDGRTLGVMTRNSPLRATSPHVSVLAHVTKDELLRVFDSTDAANGFGNRFLWLAVKRSKLLPEGGRLPDAEAGDLARRTAAALTSARKRNELRRDAEARALWGDLYADLSGGKPGMLGALIARAEAHVLRLSLLYALLDGSATIDAAHLLAALALWDYCEASARHVFGDATGDPIADRILAALRGGGPLPQAGVNDLFGRNVDAARLGRAQATLLAAGLVGAVRDGETGGRPRTVWAAT